MGGVALTRILSPRLSPPVDAALLEFVWLELAFLGTRQCQPHPVVGITT
jgi:hypothetical protein